MCDNIDGLNKKYETEYAKEDACKEMTDLENNIEFFFK